MIHSGTENHHPLGTVDLWWLNFVQIKRILNAAPLASLNELSKQGATKFRMRLNEPQGQYLRGIYPALNVLCGE